MALAPVVKPRIVLAGKAASGKDTLRARLVARGYVPDVSVTTRPKRVGEQDGVAYHYITEDEFASLERGGALYEAVTFAGWHYGTLLSSWRSSDVFIMTPTGISQINPAERASCFVIYLDAPLEVRRERLAQRSDADSVERRLAADEADFASFTDFDLRITDAWF